MKKIFLVVLLAVSGQGTEAQNLKSEVHTIPGTSVTFKMIQLPGGSFLMGSPPSEIVREEDEGPQRKVSLSPFYIGEHEVTFAEWDAFFKNYDIPQSKAVKVDAVSRPTAQYIDLTWGMGRDARNPTNSLSQTAALMYCKWLYEQTGIFFRLPTEAEWEYACRAGSAASVPENLAELKDHAFFRENSNGKYQKVKQLKPNPWGIYDMLGNLTEWTLDQYSASAYENLADGAKDPVTQPAAKYPRTARGGSYMDEKSDVRCTNRMPSRADWNQRDPQIPKSRWWLTDGTFMGFRLVRPVKQPSEQEIDAFYTAYLK